MPSINNNKAQNFLFSFSFMILLSSCSSMNVTEERVYEGGIKTVEASVAEVSELDYETKAIFANATVFFEFDSYNLTSKSIQTLKSVVSVMNQNENIKITLAGHADERHKRVQSCTWSKESRISKKLFHFKRSQFFKSFS